ncbi:MAG: hypothetical protein JW828_13735 [Sedimentisphaerales bacterium]|nr:hypothetical protein [Sedimentisphaerales bacterium]
MGPVLHGLIRLQRVENRLRAVKAKLARCRRRILFQENQLRVLQNELEAKQEEIKLTRVQSDRLELELKTRDEKVARLRAALNMAKSNKEYSAILTELNTAKADNSKVESQILDLMKNTETDEAECKEIQAKIIEQKARLEEIRKESETQAALHEKEIVAIQVEWDKAARDVPPDVLELFKRVADNYDGEALATVEQANESAELYSCGGCYMGLTAETLNQLMTHDDIIRCGSCTRILVLKTNEDI